METSNINPINSTATTRVEVAAADAKRSTSSTSSAPVDTVEISSQGAYAASLVSKVSQMSSTRLEMVENFKSQVKTGLYPPPQIVDGLMRLMGDIAVDAGKE